MRRLLFGVFFISLACLLTELSLIRVFDVLFYPNIAYMIITCSLFGYGLAGVYSVIKPFRSGKNVRVQVARITILLSISIALILPVLNRLPFNFNDLSTKPLQQIIYFAGMYATLIIPFFLAGLIFSLIFSEYARSIQSLYFYDLTGAALGSLLLIPFISKIGPGGLLLFAAAICLIAFALFAEKTAWSLVSATIAIIFFIMPILYSPKYLDFIEHQGKRGVKFARETGKIEVTVWDPISKIDIINYGPFRYIAYDGGSQNSIFYPFDGNFKTLKERLTQELDQHFWQRGVLASHVVKEGSHPAVLVIGSAGGQEIKGALLYGASHVDGVELVGAVVQLGQTTYKDYIGNLFQHPAVDIYTGEGRSFLRSTQEKYDIIQIFSNHLSSSVAAGTGAVAANYLQTSDAYQEYFSHLTENGILHINHFDYPRMITTAALAWAQMGYKDFQKHVIVYETDKDVTLPTLLIKKHPWTTEEKMKLDAFFTSNIPGDKAGYTIAVDPINPENNKIPLEYFLGHLSRTALENSETRIEPATDNRPYFNFPLKSFNPFPNGIKQFLGDPFTDLPLGLVTLYLSGLAALFYALLFIFIPLLFSNVGRQKWPARGSTLAYFSSLGLGFMIVEFVFIQLFMHLIGSPLYTYSTVIFVILFSAGVGSITSRRLKISPTRGWILPFIGIILGIILVLLFYPVLGQLFLAFPVPVRILAAALLILPAGFFMGMPFPLGILALDKQPKGSIAWAWGLNGLFTVVGGLLAVVFSIQWGFNLTLCLACAIYFLAFWMFSRLRAFSGVEIPAQGSQKLAEPDVT